MVSQTPSEAFNGAIRRYYATTVTRSHSADVPQSEHPGVAPGTGDGGARESVSSPRRLDGAAWMRQAAAEALDERYGGRTVPFQVTVRGGQIR